MNIKKHGLGSLLGLIVLLFIGKGAHSIMQKSFASISQEKEVIALFQHDAASIPTRVEAAIADVQEKINAILAIDDAERTWENTARAFDRISFSDFSILMNIVWLLKNTNTDAAIREAASEALITLEQFSVEINMHEGLYKAFKAYAQGNAPKEDLSDTQWHFIKRTLKDFERAGLDKPEEIQKRIKELEKNIAELCQNYQKNMAADQSKIIVDPQELTGLKADYIATLKKEGDKVVIGVDYPTYNAVMTQCSNGDIRKRLRLAFNNRAYPINKPILEELIAARDELAHLHGYESFAEYQLANEMVGSVARAQAFIDDVLTHANKKECEEYSMLIQNLPDEVQLDEHGRFYPWDTAYVAECYKKNHYKLDQDAIAEYFPVEKTFAGLLAIYEKFLSVRFEQVTLDGLWHEDVRTLKVYDMPSNTLLGYLFLDLHPRPFKYSHACEGNIVPATIVDGKPNVAASIVIANFPKATDDKPALFKLDDVRTFFHEFGHAMHDLLGRQEIVSMAGTNGAKYDFVEMPSQMLEEWLWDKEMLQLVSGHYKTGSPLPDTIIDTLISVKNFCMGMWLQRQLSFSNVSLHLYAGGGQRDIQAICKDAHTTCCGHIAYDEESNSYASFTHLTGYAARYYGYMWAKVFALDLFSEIKKHGLLNPEIGKRYRDCVIGKGGTTDPNQMLKDFLGREPNSTAFFSDLGL